MDSNYDSSFVRNYLRLQSRIKEFNTRKPVVTVPTDSGQTQLRLESPPLKLGKQFPSVAHLDFSLLLAGASDDELLVLAASGHFLPGMYPKSNGTRAQKLLSLLKTVRGVHQGYVVSPIAA